MVTVLLEVPVLISFFDVGVIEEPGDGLVDDRHSFGDIFDLLVG